jgi:undecaprenyl-diphosphatase
MPRRSCTIPAVWSLGCALLCAAAAAALYGGGLDPTLLLTLNATAARLPGWLPSWLTDLGHGLVAVMLVAPFLRRAPWVPAAAFAAALPAALFSRLGKLLAARPRPAAVLDPALLHVQGSVLAGHNSFPSGHSITAFLLATVILLGLACPPEGDAPRGPARVALLALGLFTAALLVAASRVMVGAHWPSDTLGGAALGVLAGLLGSWAARRWPAWRMRRAPLVLGTVVLVCAAILPWDDTGYPLARPLQWLAALLGLGSVLAQRRNGARAAADA